MNTVWLWPLQSVQVCDAAQKNRSTSQTTGFASRSMARWRKRRGRLRIQKCAACYDIWRPKSSNNHSWRLEAQISISSRAHKVKDSKFDLAVTMSMIFPLICMFVRVSSIHLQRCPNWETFLLPFSLSVEVPRRVHLRQGTHRLPRLFLYIKMWTISRNWNARTERSLRVGHDTLH